MDSSTRGEKEAARGAILRLLLMVHPDPMTFGGLQTALLIEHVPLHERDLRFHLDYLEQSGYLKVERAQVRMGKGQVKLIGLTRKGIDLLDGRIPPDAGVAL